MPLEGPTSTGLMYSGTDGNGPVVVLLHGLLMNGTLWDTVTDGLEDRYPCIVPELPFGAHTTPMPDDADLSLPALATLIAEFLTELDLHHVTLVRNDWGGAQLVISPGGTDRVANLVLVSCEAFDNYPPGLAGRLLCRSAALPGGIFLTAQLLRPRWIRHLPVIGGFSIPAASAPALSRKFAGAKAHFFASRGDPAKWELKATETIRPNPWKRRKNRDLAEETLRILRLLNCTVYTVSINKKRMHHPMTLETTAPLQMQALVEHFAVECAHHGETGLIVSDWSGYGLDTHVSQCVASFVLSRRLPLHPSVYYASSLTTQAIQVADLVAGIRRRVVEGDRRLGALSARLAAVHALPNNINATTHSGRPYTNEIDLF